MAWCELSEIVAARSTHRVFAEEFFTARPLRRFFGSLPLRAARFCGRARRGKRLLNEYKPTALDECQLNSLCKPAFFFVNKFNAINNDENFVPDTLTEFRSLIESMDFVINLDTYEACSLQSTEYIGVIFVSFQSVGGFTGIDVNNFTSDGPLLQLLEVA